VHKSTKKCPVNGFMTQSGYPLLSFLVPLAFNLVKGASFSRSFTVLNSSALLAKG